MKKHRMQTVTCSVCGETYEKRSDSMDFWQGRCGKCGKEADDARTQEGKRRDVEMKEDLKKFEAVLVEWKCTIRRITFDIDDENDALAVAEDLAQLEGE